MKVNVGEASWSDSTYHSGIYYGTDETGRKIVIKRSKDKLSIDQQEVINLIFGFQHPTLLLPLEWENQGEYLTEIYPFVEWPRLDRFSYQLPYTKVYGVLIPMFLLRFFDVKFHSF